MGLSLSFISKNAIFRNYLSASNISLLGTAIFDIAMPLYVLDRTHSPIMLSMVNVGLLLPYFLMAPLTGYIVDHFSKRRVMFFADIGQVLCMIFLLVYDLTSTPEIWPIIVTVFLTKSLMILFETVSTFHLIPALVSVPGLSEANTWFLSSQRFIQILGPITGGALMGFLGFRSCVTVNLISFSATLFFVYRLKNLDQLIDGPTIEPKRHTPLTMGNIFDKFVESIRYIWQSPLFKPFIFLMFFWNLSSLSPNTPSVTYYFRELKALTPTQYGMVVSLFGFLGILGFLSSTAFYRKFDFYRTFIGASVWQAIFATLSIGFIEHPLFLALFFATARLGSSMLSMGSFLLRQTEIPRSQVGGVNACLRMFFMSAGPLSAILQGFIIHHLGVAVSFVIGSVCLWATALYAQKVALAYSEKKAASSLAA